MFVEKINEVSDEYDEMRMSLVTSGLPAREIARLMDELFSEYAERVSNIIKNVKGMKEVYK